MQKTVKTQDAKSIGEASKESYRKKYYGPYYNPVMPQPAAIQKFVGGACTLGLGVVAHGRFTVQPIELARGSIIYIFAMAFGTEVERRIVTDAAHHAHSRAEGPGYDVNDVDLRLWVAATIYWSLLTEYEEVLGKLDSQMADQVYKEFSIMATGLRIPRQKWSADRLAFREYWDKTVSELGITDETRAVVMQALYPTSHLKTWGLMVFSMLTGPSKRVTRIELLPKRIRDELGIPSTLYTRSCTTI